MASTTRQALLQALSAAEGAYISGQQLAQQLGVSRAAVHKAAAALTTQGYALEACRAIVKYGFETLELDKIRLCTKRSNTASRILAEKIGFVQVPSSCKDSIVFCMQKGYNSLYTK